MLKGCTKKVIFVKLSDSALFEEAFFVVRPGVTPIYKEGDLLCEAKRIISGTGGNIDRSHSTSGNGSKAVRDTAFFLSGIAVAFIAVLIGQGMI